ncbi:Arylsulfatase precursor [Planctomycetes bacterium CA13]|uniref:Arylsulfatase n=1 Tax=Novipirellula herctigrandis TaxID=2527986 RepID=A0A5C5ZBV1_9BACT|nr:Arylsulfatase precursor [Planctomycetes bacterium CA13]
MSDANRSFKDDGWLNFNDGTGAVCNAGETLRFESGKMAARLPTEQSELTVIVGDLHVRDLGIAFGITTEFDGVVDVAVSNSESKLHAEHVFLEGPAFSTSNAEPKRKTIPFNPDRHEDIWPLHKFDDIKIPNVDALAKSGVLARHGYSTAPQYVPSRARLLIGKLQSKFGVEANGRTLLGFDRELTTTERLRKTGYVTAQFGKWHLGPTPNITDHGFKHAFNQNSGAPFAANIGLDGSDREYRYNLNSDLEEKHNLADKQPENPARQTPTQDQGNQRFHGSFAAAK